MHGSGVAVFVNKKKAGFIVNTVQRFKDSRFKSSYGLNGECMRIDRFEEIEAWQLARDLSRKVYNLTKKPGFARDYGLKRQMQDAAGSSMHNIAEGFDSDTNPEFVRFLRYAKRSCTEVQSELYVALDQKYITNSEFQEVYDQAGRTRAAIRGFIKYLVSYERDQRNKSSSER